MSDTPNADHGASPETEELMREAREARHAAAEAVEEAHRDASESQRQLEDEGLAPDAPSAP